jgi:hypothetical protein
MSKRLSKDLSLYERDEEGTLIPQEVELELDELDRKKHEELIGMTVSVTPMTRGEIKKLFSLSGKADDVKPETDRDADGEIILKHCHNPKYTEEEIPFLKPVITRSIVSTIFRESGIGIDKDTGRKKIEDDEFGKN